MINAFYISKSGAKNYQQYLDAVAHNLANVNTDGFKSQTVNFEELVYGDAQTEDGEVLENAVGNGSRVTVDRNMSEGMAKIDDDGTIIEGSNVDVATEMTKLIQAQRGFQMNSRMLQTADELEQYANSLRN